MDIEKLTFHTKQILKTYTPSTQLLNPKYPDFFYKIKNILIFIITNILIDQNQYWNNYGIRVEKSSEFNNCLHKLTKTEIGRGSFGVVYKVPVKTCIKNIPKNIHTVAVKIDNIDLNYFSYTPEKIKETVSITKKAADLKIGIQLYDVFVVKINNEHKLVKIYEYVQGVNWNNYKFKSTKEYNQAIKTLQEYIHIINKNGILHNDLHTENVMISTSGNIYIIDFDRASYAENFEHNDIMLFYKDKRSNNNIDIFTHYVYNELIKRKIIKIPNKTYKK
jgi:predicted Ser/Thr protein kinase